MNKTYRFETVAMLNRFLFGATTIFILVMTLLGADLLKDLYLYVAQVLPIDPAWVKKHATEISNAGHLVSCFILTCLGFSVFRKSYLKAMGFVAALAVSGELLQKFSVTRQANVEDIALGFAGILLAAVFFFLIKKPAWRRSWGQVLKYKFFYA